MKFEAIGISVLLGLSMIAGAGDAAAQGARCAPLCRVSCVRPISIPDRWDNVTGIPGYMGEVSGRSRRPEWRNNDQWDYENFTDANGNVLYDVGENYIDDNRNGMHDEELYDPWLTGYTADGFPGHRFAPAGDLGLQLVLHPYSGAPPHPGQYVTVGFPPTNKGTPDLTSIEYRNDWATCDASLVEPADLLQPTASSLTGPTNQVMQDMIASDPGAYWDASAGAVAGSAFAVSPRVFALAAHDPRIASRLGNAGQVVVRKILAFFGEQVVGSAELRGRFLRVQSAGEACGGGSSGGFAVECPVPTTATSWGRIKGTYR